MLQNNFTTITEIHLLGFHNLYHFNILFFIVFFIIYCLTTCWNLLLVVAVAKIRSLHAPMYIFLTQLSLSDIIMTNSISPILLHVLVDKPATITFTGCLAQYYFFCASLAFDTLLLTVMSYDRYLAICNPLRYNTIMNYVFCLKLIISSWFLGFSAIIKYVFEISDLKFCGSNVIDHFFCDLSPLLALSCSDTYVLQVEVTIITISLSVFPFLLIITSYCYIICTILRIPSVTGRQKAFSTCSSHLTVVSMFFGSLLCTYAAPTRGQSSTSSKVLSLSYTVMIPLINPLIYSFRNNDIKEAFHKTCRIY
ncbi:olfactory receptor 11L1-like [Rana temporaria]|uniref:olfactory receptor 11L1-like n=1 Tax=Rana temporaria TaxID=8407 RepID=UPI001AADCC83|nr:olfactory receptor 11L1-like [Rana temporaria]